MIPNKLFLYLFLLLFIFNCYNPNKEQEKNTNEFTKRLFFQLVVLSKGTKEVGTVVDNKDGTLNYTYTLIETNGWIGDKVISERKLLIRRCLIGQIYRKVQNDCQGTGTKETVWGASQLQWCPTNDRSCETNGKADPTKSPAAKACAEDSFAGKKWSLPSKDDGLGNINNYHKTNASIYNDWERYTNYGVVSWSKEASSDEMVFSAFGNGSVANKNSDKVNILCVGDI
jgi:hypothetical protein